MYFEPVVIKSSELSLLSLSENLSSYFVPSGALVLIETKALTFSPMSYICDESVDAISLGSIVLIILSGMPMLGENILSSG